MSKRYEVKDINLAEYSGCYHIIDRMFGDGVREMFHYRDGETKKKAFEIATEVCERYNYIQSLIGKKLND